MEKIPVRNTIKCETCGKRMKKGKIIMTDGLELLFVCGECYKKIRKGGA